MENPSVSHLKTRRNMKLQLNLLQKIYQFMYLFLLGLIGKRSHSGALNGLRSISRVCSSKFIIKYLLATQRQMCLLMPVRSSNITSAITISGFYNENIKAQNFFLVSFLFHCLLSNTNIIKRPSYVTSISAI